MCQQYRRNLCKGLHSEEMEEGSVIPRGQVWCFPVSRNFLCYFQTQLCREKNSSRLLTSCVGGMKEAVFQSAAFQRSCCLHFCQSGGSLTLSFLFCDKISRNSLHGFYEQLCSTDSARNEADAWSQTYCMKLAVSLLLLHLAYLDKSLLHVLCSIAVFHTVSFYVLFTQVFYTILHAPTFRSWHDEELTTLQICMIHIVFLFVYLFSPALSLLCL